MAPSSPKYSELKDDASSLLSDPDEGAYDRHIRARANRQWTTRRWITVLVSSLLSTNIASILMASKVARSSIRCQHVFEPPKGIPPFFSYISLELHPEYIKSPFYDTDPNIYRKHDSPETEAAWRELIQLGAFCFRDLLRLRNQLTF
jgi:hypothetical protein